MPVRVCCEVSLPQWVFHNPFILASFYGFTYCFLNYSKILITLCIICQRATLHLMNSYVFQLLSYQVCTWLVLLRISGCLRVKTLKWFTWKVVAQNVWIFLQRSQAKYVLKYISTYLNTYKIRTMQVLTNRLKRNLTKIVA